jgi:hypothetical protein
MNQERTFTQSGRTLARPDPEVDSIRLPAYGIAIHVAGTNTTDQRLKAP